MAFANVDPCIKSNFVSFMEDLIRIDSRLSNANHQWNCSVSDVS